VAEGLNLVFVKLDPISPMRRNQLSVSLVWHVGHALQSEDYVFAIRLSGEGQRIGHEVLYQPQLSTDIHTSGQLMYDRQEFDLSPEIAEGPYEVTLEWLHKDGSDDSAEINPGEIVLGEIHMPSNEGESPD
jgi:hypothetical protein